MRHAVRRLKPCLPALLAGTLALVAVTAGLRGVDFPAQLYRVGLFHRDGLVLWDSQWYGGHWMFDYSVIFPPIAGVIGIQATAVLSAVGAAMAFDRLVVGHFGDRARSAALVFAVGTLTQVAIGQLPFLLGEGLALAACLAISRRRWVLAAALAAAAALASPLAGGFLALGTVAWLGAKWPSDRAGLAVVTGAGLAPVLVTAAIFPGTGAMPFPAWDFVQLIALFAALWLLIPRDERALRIGTGVYIVAIAAAFAVASPVGGNISRLGECLGAPLAVAALPPRRRWLIAAAVVPLIALQWSPAYANVAAARNDPSTHAAYFSPLLRFLRSHAYPAGRIEVVPTRLHWEAAFVAPRFPLARGWERQLDTADNPVFYRPGALTSASYRAWLVDNGVRYVALPDVPLDYAAESEGRLVATGVPGLGPPHQAGHWRVFPVSGSAGLVDGQASVTRLDGGQLTLDVQDPGTIVVRVRYDPRWTVVGSNGCLSPGPGRWMTLTASRRGEVRMQLRLIGDHDGLCA